MMSDKVYLRDESDMCLKVGYEELEVILLFDPSCCSKNMQFLSLPH